MGIDNPNPKKSFLKRMTKRYVRAAAFGAALAPVVLAAEIARDFADVAVAIEKSVEQRLESSDTDESIATKFENEVNSMLKTPAIMRANIKRALTTPDLRWSNIVLRYGNSYYPHIFLREVFEAGAFERHRHLAHAAIEKTDPVMLKLLHSETKVFPSESVRIAIEKRMQSTAFAFVKIAAHIQQKAPSPNEMNVDSGPEKRANVTDELLSLVAQSVLEKTGPEYWEQAEPGWMKEFVFKQFEGREFKTYLAFMQSISRSFDNVDPIVLFKRVITVSDYLYDQKLPATTKNVLKALAESAAALERHGSYNVFKRDVVLFYGNEKSVIHGGMRFTTPETDAGIQERQKMSGGTYTFTKKMYDENAGDRNTVLKDIASTVLSQRPGSTIFFKAHGLPDSWYPNTSEAHGVKANDFADIFERRGLARLKAIAAGTDAGELDFVHFGSCYSRNLIASIGEKLSPSVRKLYMFSSESQWDLVSFSNLKSSIAGSGVTSTAMEMLIDSKTLREYVEKMRVLNSGNNGAVLFPSMAPKSTHIQVSMTLGLEGVHPLLDTPPAA